MQFSKRKLFGIFMLFILILYGCKNKPSNTINQDPYHITNAAAIPLSVREREVEKENLLMNSSFEEGKFYISDTVKLSFNLPGWKRIGDNVFWTNTENKKYMDDDASHGSHAIKISRTKANETHQEGEGVMSDYIKVIPGNYQLSFDARFDHIESNLKRLINCLYDAVNIRIFFYDKNKILIKGPSYHPEIAANIDNSFKASSFSGIDYIESMPWMRIMARAGDFPFEEGNIPEHARYVRIFLGLKGTGDMWIDMVDFRYTKLNFSFLERVHPFIDSALNRADYLMPQPHEIGNQKYIPFYKKAEVNVNKSPVVLISPGLNNQAKTLINDFIIGLRQKSVVKSTSGILKTKLNSSQISQRSLIFCFGNSSLSNKYASFLPLEEISDKKEAYFIKSIEEADNLVFIGYSDNSGLFRAVNTLNQLIQSSDTLYYHYDIIDYPDFEKRNVVIPVENSHNSELEKVFKYLGTSGFNSFISEPADPELYADEFLKEAEMTEKQFGKVNKFNTFQLGYSLKNLKLSYVKENKAGNWINSSENEFLEKDIKMLTGLMDRLLKEDPSSIILSDLSLWTSLDFGTSPKAMKMVSEKEFDKYLALREVFWDEIYPLKETSNQTRFLLYPLIASNKSMNHLNKKTIQLFDHYPEKSPLFSGFLWNGPTDYSTIIDKLDLIRFQNETKGNVYLIDNTCTERKDDRLFSNYAAEYYRKTQFKSLFEPYEVKFEGINPEDLQNEVFIKAGGHSSLDLIRLSTAADYFWNTRDYDPCFSIWKNLVMLYGKENAIDLVMLNDLYYKLMEINQLILKEGASGKNTKAGEEIIIEMEEYWKRITLNLAADIDLLNNLTDYKNGVISRFYQSVRRSDTR